MKAHVGIDSRTKLVRAAVAMPADTAESIVMLDLLHSGGPIAAQRPVIRRYASKPGFHQSPITC